MWVVRRAGALGRPNRLAPPALIRRIATPHPRHGPAHPLLRSRSVPAPSAYTLAREILTADPDLGTDAAVLRIKAAGVTRPDIRKIVNRTRSDLRGRKGKPRPAAAAARTTTQPRPGPNSEPKPADADAEAVFASVALANRTAKLCGGVAKAREVAEAIRACGGVDAFLKRLELVAEILGSETNS